MIGRELSPDRVARINECKDTGCTPRLVSYHWTHAWLRPDVVTAAAVSTSRRLGQERNACAICHVPVRDNCASS